MQTWKSIKKHKYRFVYLYAYVYMYTEELPAGLKPNGVLPHGATMGVVMQNKRWNHVSNQDSRGR